MKQALAHTQTAFAAVAFAAVSSSPSSSSRSLSITRSSSTAACSGTVIPFSTDRSCHGRTSKTIAAKKTKTLPSTHHDHAHNQCHTRASMRFLSNILLNRSGITQDSTCENYFRSNQISPACTYTQHKSTTRTTLGFC